jgi:hypothetical protein
LDQILEGTFLDNLSQFSDLSDSQKQWIAELKSIVETEISLSLSYEDFKSFFRPKQEQTGSSPSGRHMGHYHTLL